MPGNPTSPAARSITRQLADHLADQDPARQLLTPEVTRYLETLITEACQEARREERARCTGTALRKVQGYTGDPTYVRERAGALAVFLELDDLKDEPGGLDHG